MVWRSDCHTPFFFYFPIFKTRRISISLSIFFFFLGGGGVGGWGGLHKHCEYNMVVILATCLWQESATVDSTEHLSLFRNLFRYRTCRLHEIFILVHDDYTYSSLKIPFTYDKQPLWKGFLHFNFYYIVVLYTLRRL